MIVKFAQPGRSFKGVLQYLTHDPDHAQTSERVAWTHTLNLAHDDINAATREMISTARNAGILKAAHGIGGRSVEKPVRHVSLNWHPSEKPEREAMVAAAQSFLKHMGWDEHQTVIIAHDDKAHRHVHLVINAIHPEFGRKLDDGLERRRAQAWALQYEQAHGVIHCQERLKQTEQRQDAVPRPTWMAMREEALAGFKDDYLNLHDNRDVLEGREWELLKAAQRAERLAFFENGREAYRSVNGRVFREVREEFRNEWASYYAAKREGLDARALAEMRQDLTARQAAVLDDRRSDAMAETREHRDLQYRDLLDRQKDERAELADRQEQGLRSYDLLDRSYPVGDHSFRVEAQSEHEEISDPLDRFGVRRGRDQQHDVERADPVFAQYGNTDAPELGGNREPLSGLASGLLGAIGHLGDALLGGTTKPPPKPQASADALDRFNIQRGQSPPGDAQEKAAREAREAGDARKAWRGWHHYEQER